MIGQILIAPLGGKPDPVRVLSDRLRSAGPGVGIVVEIGRERPRPASLLAPEEAKQIETALEAARPGVVARARGDLVFVSVEDSDELPDVISALREASGDRPVGVVATPGRYRELLELGWDSVVVTGSRGQAEPEEDSSLPPLTELILEEAREFAGEADLVTEPARGSRLIPRLRSSRGQATPLVLGAVFALVLGAVAIMAVSGAVTGKAKAQRTADLSAMSAVRSMKDDLPRLLAPPTLPNGLPNPAHMPKPVYLGRARLAAVEAAVTNGASPLAVRVRFPDSYSFAPVRAKVSIATSVRAGTGGGSHRAPPNWAEARISVPVSMGSVPSFASGGGYSGPLAERQGKGMRPDVAAAFDAMSAAAAAAGITLTINSAFRSDAEQAALFAANPDPTWVAPPGQSLHRCATELDLGPAGAYGWLAANAGRFGFTQRYSWEAWHYES